MWLSLIEYFFFPSNKMISNWPLGYSCLFFSLIPIKLCMAVQLDVEHAIFALLSDISQFVLVPLHGLSVSLKLCLLIQSL